MLHCILLRAVSKAFQAASDCTIQVLDSRRKVALSITSSCEFLVLPKTAPSLPSYT